MAKRHCKTCKRATEHSNIEPVKLGAVRSFIGSCILSFHGLNADMTDDERYECVDCGTTRK